LLTGPDVSPIQHYALSIFDVLDVIEKHENKDRELRLALIAGGLADPEDLFPELKKVITDDEAEIDEGSDMQGNAIATKYDFSHAELNRSQAEVEDEVRKMLEMAASGEATFDSSEYEDWI
jgi:hypothetical protein